MGSIAGAPLSVRLWDKCEGLGWDGVADGFVAGGWIDFDTESSLVVVGFFDDIQGLAGTGGGVLLPLVAEGIISDEVKQATGGDCLLALHFRDLLSAEIEEGFTIFPLIIGGGQVHHVAGGEGDFSGFPAAVIALEKALHAGCWCGEAREEMANFVGIIGLVGEQAEGRKETGGLAEHAGKLLESALFGGEQLVFLSAGQEFFCAGDAGILGDFLSSDGARRDCGGNPGRLEAGEGVIGAVGDVSVAGQTEFFLGGLGDEFGEGDGHGIRDEGEPWTHVALAKGDLADGKEAGVEGMGVDVDDWCCVDQFPSGGSGNWERDRLMGGVRPASDEKGAGESKWRKGFHILTKGAWEIRSARNAGDESPEESDRFQQKHFEGSRDRVDQIRNCG